MAEEKPAPAPKTQTTQTPQKAMKAAKAAKVPWTQARCLKAARRFESEATWHAGAPASYKAASAKGWLKACLSAQKPKAAAPRRPLKKSA